MEMTERFWLSRDGEVYGPYEKEQLREMSRAGELLNDDQLCREGVEPRWLHFHLWRKVNLRTDTVKIPVGEGRGQAEGKSGVQNPGRFSNATAVTPKQRALLEYLGWPVPETKFEASELIDEACNNPDMDEQMRGWTMDRLQIHPELYAKEKAVSREGMARLFKDHINENLGPWNPIKRITLDVARSAVAYLDACYPGWDSKVWNAGFPDCDEVDRWACESIAAVHAGMVKKGRAGDFGQGKTYRRL